MGEEYEEGMDSLAFEYGIAVTIVLVLVLVRLPSIQRTSIKQVGGDDPHPIGWLLAACARLNGVRRLGRSRADGSRSAESPDSFASRGGARAW